MTSTRKNVTQYIYALLCQEFPDVEWSVNVSGANRNKKLVGTISCDEIEYERRAKLSGGQTLNFAIAQYSIYLVDTNSPEGVDDIADDVYKLLDANGLGTWCVDSRIKKVYYGTAKGNSSVGVALLEYEVRYEADV